VSKSDWQKSSTIDGRAAEFLAVSTHQRQLLRLYIFALIQYGESAAAAASSRQLGCTALQHIEWTLHGELGNNTKPVPTKSQQLQNHLQQARERLHGYSAQEQED
jgi:hypothetical protein